MITIEPRERSMADAGAGVRDRVRRGLDGDGVDVAPDEIVEASVPLVKLAGDLRLQRVGAPGA
jgi:hypothetical protein